MPEQVHATRKRTERTEPGTPPSGAAQREHAEKMKAAADAVLDEIDAALEEAGINTEVEAQEFVTGYRQAGGE